MKKLLVITASDGKNLELANKTIEESGTLNFQAELVSLIDLDLPLYSSREEINGVPEQAKALSNQVKQSDALVIISPEYNGSMAPTLNNAIAWISRSGDDWREAFNAKPVLIATHSGSGGSHVLMAMRQQLSYIGANVIGRQILTGYSKELNLDSLKSCLKQL